MKNDYTIKPEATMLHVTPLYIGEVAARTCYDSFKSSEHETIKEFDSGLIDEEELESITESELLSKLSWVFHHESVLEHISCNFLIKDTSRAVLMELSRHRIASYSVRSTRYTMGDLLIAFLAANYTGRYSMFADWVKENKVFIVTGELLDLEIKQCYDKLTLIIRRDYGHVAYDKNSYNYIGKLIAPLVSKATHEELVKFTKIEDFFRAKKNKKNLGDGFKGIVTDNWRVDLMLSINLRSLKNLIKLRDSGAAFKQIQTLAKELQKELPKGHLDLIVKNKTNS